MKKKANHPKRRLSRDFKDSWIGGVCSGLGKYLNIDASIIRIIWLCFLLIPEAEITEITFILYIILWIVLPED